MHYCYYMKCTCDPEKRAKTLAERGLDMAEAAAIFEGPHLTFDDIRFEYGEQRYVTIGHLRGRMIVIAWTPRDGSRRIISMRKANDREEKKYGHRLG